MIGGGGKRVGRGGVDERRAGVQPSSLIGQGGSQPGLEVGRCWRQGGGEGVVVVLPQGGSLGTFIAERRKKLLLRANLWALGDFFF